MSARDEADPVAPLLGRVAAGDRAAFRKLYAEVGGKLFAVVLRILGNRADAEDALQDIFARVWTAAARYDASKGRGMTWLVVLARNQAIDRLRRAPHDPARGNADDEEALQRVADPTPGAEAALMAQGEARRIAACLETLAPEHAAAVRGAYLSGKSYEALAAAHGVPLNTMRTWLRRSLLKLRECLRS